MNATTHLIVSPDDQSLRVMRGARCIREFTVSTAALGTGFVKDSYRTPTGRFRIVETIGDGMPYGTVFKNRVATGLWQPGTSATEDLILTRILRLDGLDADNANTLERCIYIHGTNREDQLGTPASHGCIRMSNADVIELCAMVAPGDLLDIMPPAGGDGAHDIA